MKFLAVAFLLLVLALIRNDLINAFSPPPDLSSFKGEVKLYSTVWCGYCKKARSLLKATGVNFVELDIEKSQQAEAEYRKLGGRGVPVIVVGDVVLHGFDRERLLRVFEGVEGR